MRHRNTERQASLPRYSRPIHLQPQPGPCPEHRCQMCSRSEPRTTMCGSDTPKPFFNRSSLVPMLSYLLNFSAPNQNKLPPGGCFWVWCHTALPHSLQEEEGPLASCHMARCSSLRRERLSCRRPDYPEASVWKASTQSQEDTSQRPCGGKFLGRAPGHTSQRSSDLGENRLAGHRHPKSLLMWWQGHSKAPRKGLRDSNWEADAFGALIA